MKKNQKELIFMKHSVCCTEFDRMMSHAYPERSLRSRW